MSIQKSVNGIIAVGLFVAWLTPAPAAELCKWVDENGTVHYAETCPDSLDAGAVTVEDKDPEARGDDPYAESRARLEQRGQAAQAGAQAQGQPQGQPQGRQMGRTQDFSGMSPAQLASECERQREARLGPERRQLIAQCTAQGEKSASACERFYADWGNGGRQGGHTVPRKYDNLPVCVAARGGRN